MKEAARYLTSKIRAKSITVQNVFHIDEHIFTKIKKASIMFGLIWRPLSFFKDLLFKNLFTAFVIPHLEYTKVNCALDLKNYINTLKAVQHYNTNVGDGMDVTF